MKRNANKTLAIKQDIVGRCTWTYQEDALLAKLATLHKGKKWRLVAELVTSLSRGGHRTKTPKQCRERWHTHLSPDIVATPWSAEEQRKFFDAHKALGNRWAEIAACLPGRTDNAVKNFFFCRLRKLARCLKNRTLELEPQQGIEEASQVAYLLSHLYTYYISSKREENFQKTLYPRIMGRKNQGDKYIVDLVTADPSMRYYFNNFVKGLLNRLNKDILHVILQEYPQFQFGYPSELANTSSKVLIDSLSMPLGKSSRKNSTVEGKQNSSESTPTSVPNLRLTLPTIAFSLKPGATFISETLPSFNFGAYGELIASKMRPETGSGKS